MITRCRKLSGPSWTSPAPVIVMAWGKYLGWCMQHRLRMWYCDRDQGYMPGYHTGKNRCTLQHLRDTSVSWYHRGTHSKGNVLTAEPISAEKAYSLGILNHIVPHEELEEYTLNIAKKDHCQLSPEYPGYQRTTEHPRKFHATSPTGLWAHRHATSHGRYQQGYQEGLKAFYEKRKPDFKGEWEMSWKIY